MNELCTVHSVQVQDIGLHVGDHLLGQRSAVSKGQHPQRGVWPRGCRTVLDIGVDAVDKGLSVLTEELRIDRIKRWHRAVGLSRDWGPYPYPGGRGMVRSPDGRSWPPKSTFPMKKEAASGGPWGPGIPAGAGAGGKGCAGTWLPSPRWTLGLPGREASLWL